MGKEHPDVKTRPHMYEVASGASSLRATPLTLTIHLKVEHKPDLAGSRQ